MSAIAKFLDLGCGSRLVERRLSHLYYRLGKTKRRVTLGRYPDVPLKDARTLARQALSRIAEGQDPQTEKLTKRQTHDQELFREIVADYIKTHVDRKRNRKAQLEPNASC